MRCAAGSCNDETQPTLMRAGSVPGEILGGAMSGNHLYFVRDLELSASVSGGFHRRPIRVAAHQYTNPRQSRFVLFHMHKIRLASGGHDDRASAKILS